ncbi:MAG: hypothetical protein M5U34_15695 [Chloroflexi bacterium]|nr:hypothetical protein [Chloroflexota bacterium]
MALIGDHQLGNAMVALAALNHLRPYFPALSATAVRQGLADVTWNGRLQTVYQSEQTATFLVDCAHNPDSVARLVDALNHHYTYQRLILLFGAPADKDVAKMLAPLVPLAYLTITAAADHPRAAQPESLAQIVRELGGTAVIAASAAEGLTTAWQNAQPGDPHLRHRLHHLCWRLAKSVGQLKIKLVGPRGTIAHNGRYPPLA